MIPARFILTLPHKMCIICGTAACSQTHLVQRPCFEASLKEAGAAAALRRLPDGVSAHTCCSAVHLNIPVDHWIGMFLNQGPRLLQSVCTAAARSHESVIEQRLSAPSDIQSCECQRASYWHQFICVGSVECSCVHQVDGINSTRYVCRCVCGQADGVQGSPSGAELRFYSSLNELRTRNYDCRFVRPSRLCCRAPCWCRPPLCS